MNRRSLSVKLGRIYQKISPVFTGMDIHLFNYLFLKNQREDVPVICIIAPPRSGSTLMYQVLTTGIKNFHLTNIWNLLYATPSLGGFLSQELCKNYKSGFSSTYGFVPGLCGEAEGAAFWSYWGGYTMEESDNINQERTLLLKQVIEKIPGNKKKAFITGYIGHAFYTDMLASVFENIIFIHLTRDLLSNSFSLFNYSDKEWRSVKPKEYGELENMNRHRQVAIQPMLVHQKILRQHQHHKRFIVDYAELCNDPLKVVSNICNFGKERGMQLEIGNINQIPSFFQFNRIPRDHSEDTVIINNYINEYIHELDDKNEKAFLLKLNG